MWRPQSEEDERLMFRYLDEIDYPAQMYWIRGEGKCRVAYPSGGKLWLYSSLSGSDPNERKDAYLRCHEFTGKKPICESK